MTDLELRKLDLIKRIPYKPLCEVTYDKPDSTLVNIKTTENLVLHGYDGINFIFDSGVQAPIECIKPYLRKLDSMTEEQKKLLNVNYSIIVSTGSIVSIYDLHDWLLENHFDIHLTHSLDNLIDLGYALELID